jgi:hypothetical protein
MISSPQQVAATLRAFIRSINRWVLADFVCSVQPGAADGVAFDGVDHFIEGEAGW